MKAGISGSTTKTYDDPVRDRPIYSKRSQGGQQLLVPTVGQQTQALSLTYLSNTVGGNRSINDIITTVVPLAIVLSAKDRIWLSFRYAMK